MKAHASGEKVAALVVGYNSQSYLPRLFDSLRKVKGLEKAYFLDCGTDGSLELVKKEYPEVEIVASGGNIGFAAGNNRLMEQAAADGATIFFLVNPDTMVEPGAVNELMKEHQPDRILQPLILTSKEGEKTDRINTSGNPLHPLGFSYAGGNSKPADSVGPELTPIAVASGASCWIPAALAKDLQGFDESFFTYHEDTDFSWRARLKGVEIFLVPRAIVYHDYVFSKSSLKYYYVERNRLLMMTKNYRIWSLLLLLPFGLITEVALILFALLEGFLPAKLKAYGGYFAMLPMILLQRGKVQRARTVSDRVLARRMTPVLQFSEVESPLLKPYNLFSRLYTVLFRALTY